MANPFLLQSPKSLPYYIYKIYIRCKIKENSAISMPTMPKTTLFLQFFAIFLFHIIESFNFVTLHITIIIFYRQ